MSIVKMKRMKLIALSADRQALFEEIMRLGTVELTDAPEHLKDKEWAEVAGRDVSALSLVKTQATEINSALDAMNKYTPVKKSIFASRPTMEFEDIFNSGAVQAALVTAGEINEIARGIVHSHVEENRLNNRRVSLLPWEKFDAPLNISSTREVEILPGVCPSSISIDDLTEFLKTNAPMSELFLINSDKEQHYLLFVCHKEEFDAAMDELKKAGFSRTQFKDAEGAASECIKNTEADKARVLSEREALVQKLASYNDYREMLMCCSDRIAQELSREQARESLIATKETIYLEGWTCAPNIDYLEAVLEKYGCWYEFADPDKDEDVPILLSNTPVIKPFNMVVEMYGLPKYSHVDPNPLIAPFFAVFFGLMYGDAAYGLVLLTIGIFMIKKLKPKGLMDQLFRLMIICGISTVFFGIIYGEFFGDSIASIGKTFFGLPSNFEAKAGIFGLFDPLDNPLITLIIALGIGVFHMMTGMIIKIVLLCRAGRPLDALMDVGSWWLLFAGFALLALGKGSVVVWCGVAALVLTQGRRSKTIAGKIVGGLVSLYRLTNYFSDVLSYSRLMALAMATSVIAMVFNLLASMVGGVPWLGVILYALVFIVGHVFNIGVNIISTFVHSARLQYLEYFSKFYESGGVAFKPFAIKTRFVDIIIKEEK